MKNTLITLIILLIASNQSPACINAYRTLLSGEVIYTDPSSGLPYYEKPDSLTLISKLSALDKLHKTNRSVETLSDYGAVLIYLGRLEEAVDLYRKIEREHPNLYATAANIGTAFELLGQIDSAHHYIRKAIAINPHSHNGSEWIHLKILDAKRKLAADPDYLQNNSILGIDFGNGNKPVEPKHLSLADLEDQIRFQLKERMVFVKAPDLIVGQLLFDLGNSCALTRDVQAALECYALAEAYGYHSDLLSKRISTLKPLAFMATVADSARKHYFITLFIVTAGGLMLLWLTRKVIRRLSRS